VIFKAPS